MLMLLQLIVFTVLLLFSAYLWQSLCSSERSPVGWSHICKASCSRKLVSASQSGRSWSPPTPWGRRTSERTKSREWWTNTCRIRLSQNYLHNIKALKKGQRIQSHNILFFLLLVTATTILTLWWALLNSEQREEKNRSQCEMISLYQNQISQQWTHSCTCTYYFIYFYMFIFVHFLFSRVSWFV